MVDGEERQVFTAPYVRYSEAVNEIVSLLDRIGAVHPFDWSGWESAERYRRPGALRAAPVADAAGMATVIVRRDRFCEGAIASAVDDGTFTSVVERLLRWYDQDGPAAGADGRASR